MYTRQEVIGRTLVAKKRIYVLKIHFMIYPFQQSMLKLCALRKNFIQKNDNLPQDILP